MSVTSNGLTSAEAITELYFNVNSAVNLTSLSFAFGAASTAPSASGNGNGIFTGIDAHQADGGGRYDLLFDLPPPPGQQTVLFGANETLLYTITGSGLSAVSFYELAATGGGNGVHYSAAHIQRIGPTGSQSGWVAPSPSAVPVPATVWLLVSGIGALVAARRRKPAAS